VGRSRRSGGRSRGHAGCRAAAGVPQRPVHAVGSSPSGWRTFHGLGLGPSWPSRHNLSAGDRNVPSAHGKRGRRRSPRRSDRGPRARLWATRRTVCGSYTPIKKWCVTVSPGRLQPCLASSASVSVSFSHVQHRRIPARGWAIGWATPSRPGPTSAGHVPTAATTGRRAAIHRAVCGGRARRDAPGVPASIGQEAARWDSSRG
jgi:hypothetical protein